MAEPRLKRLAAAFFATETANLWRIPWLVGFVLVLVSGTLWRAFLISEEEKFLRVSGVEQVAIRDRFEQALQDRILSLERLARDLERRQLTNEEWQAEERKYRQHFPALARIEVLPKGAVSALDLLAERSEGTEALFSRAVLVDQGRWGFGIGLAMNGKRENRVLLGTFLLDEFVASLRLSPDYDLLIKESGREAYSTLVSPGSPPGASHGEFDQRWGRSFSLPLGSRWSLHVAPTQARVRASYGSLPGFVLISGLIISLLVAFAARFAMVARWQTRRAGGLLARLESVMSFAPVGIFQADPAGRLVYVNRRFCELSGLSEAEALGNGWQSALDSEDRERVIADWSQAVREQGTYLAEFRFVAKEGAISWVSGRSVGLRDLKGEVTGYLGAVQDITQRKEAEGIIEQQRLRIVHSEKMTALGEMAGGIAHEVNNPLAILQGNADVLRGLVERGTLEPERLLKISGVMHSMTDRIAKIIRGLRAFARDGHSDPFEKTALKRIIEDTLEFCMARFAHHGVALRQAEFDETLAVECRSVQIAQVLLNLLNNAFDAVEGRPAAQVEVEVKDLGDTVDICVTDSGPGVPDEVAARIMQPFFTTKDPGKGTGLGLSISTSIATTHGGTLFLDRSFPKTRFVLRLPKIHV